MVASISPNKLSEIVASGRKVSLIDVRTPAEFPRDPCPFRRQLLTGSAIGGRGTKPLPSAEPVYIICKSGSRGSQACQKLEAAGLSNVINVEGGTAAWEAVGLPVVRGKEGDLAGKTGKNRRGDASPDGAALGFFIHPAWIGLSAFIGAGLIFAGVTDTCGMAMMLARMPWNQVKDQPAPTCTFPQAKRTMA